MNNQLTYREKFTCEMIWGGVPTDNDYVRNSALFQEGLKRYDSGEWKYYEKEEWRDVKGWEGHYQVSNHGNVKSIGRYIKVKNQLRFYKSIILKGGISAGYYYVTFREQGTKMTEYIHRLVAQEFIPNPKSKPCVNHINGIKTDNHISNLEWVTKHENNTFEALRKGNRDSGIRYKGGKYELSVCCLGSSKYIGRYETLEAARVAKKLFYKRSNVDNKYINND